MSDKPKWPQTIAEFLIDNLTVLLTIGFAGFIIYRQEIAQTALSIDDLLTAILGVLALLATSEIVERYRKLNSIEKMVNRALSFLESRFTERPSAIAFFMKAEFGTKSNFRRSALLGMQIPRLRAQMRWKRIPYNRLPADFRFEPANLHSQARASGPTFNQ